MSPDELIAESQVPNTKHVYFLGCFESRVTILSQQIRALNLADALIEKKIIRENTRVAVIGGGAAGLTFATAIGLGRPDIKEVDLFEQKGELLHIQNPGRDRYVHPHLYDWPASEIGRIQAELPILNWTAGSASDVANQIIEGFQFLQLHAPKIRLHVPRTVTDVKPQKHSGCFVRIKDANLEGGSYDVVVLAIGFGLETLISETNPSYWSPSILASAIPSSSEHQTIFITGNGDGGLVDFSMAAFNGLSHENITRYISEYHGLDFIKAELMRIEKDAWSGGVDIDIFKEYEKKIILPDDMYMRVAEKLRKNTKIIFHTRQSRLFRRETSVLNRFVAFVVIVASENAGFDNIKIITGKNFEGNVPVSGEVFLEGEVPFVPSYRFLRIGADAVRNLNPFLELVEQYRAKVFVASTVYRPATPSLSLSALHRFEKHSPPATAQSTQINQKEREAEVPHVRPENIANPDALEVVAKSLSTEILDSTVGLLNSELTRFNGNLLSPIASDGVPLPFQLTEQTSKKYRVRNDYKDMSFSAAGPTKTAGLKSEQKNSERGSKGLVPEIIRAHENEVSDLFERESVSSSSNEVGQNYLTSILFLIEHWEFSSAISLSGEIEEWIYSNEGKVSDDLRVAIYTALARVEILRFERDNSNEAKLNDAKIRSFLNKAKYDRSENR